EGGGTGAVGGEPGTDAGIDGAGTDPAVTGADGAAATGASGAGTLDDSIGAAGGGSPGCMPSRCITRDTDGGGMLSRRRATSSSMTSPVSSPRFSASTIRVVVAKRFSASLASILVTAASIHSGTPGRRVGSGCGISVTCLVRMSNTRLPENGGWLVSISYATQPS